MNELKVQDIKTKGKFMYWVFDCDWFMFSTFGMSGMWAIRKEKHPCFVLEFSDENYSNHQQLAFNDPRHFGTIKFTNNKQDLINKLNSLGWDPLSEELTPSIINTITNRFAKSNKTISQVLMDQSIFAGVGNYLKCEILYASHISPWRSCNLLTAGDIVLICQSAADIAKASYQNNGASLHTYTDANGNKGNYSNFFKVYGRKLDPLGNQIIRETTPDKRTTHWSPTVQ